VQLGEPIAVGSGALIPYKPSTPSVAPHEAARRTQGARRIPSQLDSVAPARPARRNGSALQAMVAISIVALSGLAAFAMMVSHVVG
jgi:hypothetical protein